MLAGVVSMLALIFLAAVWRRTGDKPRPLDPGEMPRVRRLSDDARREAALPFE